MAWDLRRESLVADSKIDAAIALLEELKQQKQEIHHHYHYHYPKSSWTTTHYPYYPINPNTIHPYFTYSTGSTSIPTIPNTGADVKKKDDKNG